MGPYKDLAVLMLIIAGLLAGAIIFLRVRDRRTLRPEMSAAEHRSALARNTAQTFRWWHVAGLAAAINALFLDRNRIPHQRAWVLVFDASIAALLVFLCYRKRSDKQNEPVSSGNSAPPIH